MKQLVRLQDVYSEFEARNTAVIAVAQEDTDLAKHARILDKLDGAPRFDLVADIERKGTARYHRTNAYLIDKRGVVREIFPMMIHHRATWAPVLEQIDRMTSGG